MIRWALCLLLAGCVHTPTHNELRATTLTLRFETGICSGTAIAPDKILTARHCTMGGKLLTANDVPVSVRRTELGATDRLIIDVAKPTFTHIATLGGIPTQGQRVRLWGSPKGERDVFREGYVSRVRTDGVVLDVYACPGDSGAAAFNDAGQIVAIVSYLTVPTISDVECRFTVAVANP